MKFLPLQKTKSQPWARGHRRGQARPVVLTVTLQEAELLVLLSREGGFEVNSCSLGLVWSSGAAKPARGVFHRGVQAEFGAGHNANPTCPSSCASRPGLTARLPITMSLKAPA